MDEESKPSKPSIDENVGASTEPKITGNTLLREDLVNTAVKFLQSAKVRQTPLSHRKAFLAKKGLTDAEIQEALARTESLVGPLVEENAALSPYQQHHVGVPPPPRPLPVTWRDYATAVVFVSGASYAAFKFVRGYVLPTWFNIPDPERERMRRLDDNMNDVQNGLKFLVDSVQQTLGVVQQQQETLNRLVNQLIEKDKSSAAQDRAIQELRNEIATVKSLLLSRDQFPPLPTIANSASAPGIPAWQLTTGIRQQPLLNGNHKNGSTNNRGDNRFQIGFDDDDETSVTDGYAASEEPYVSATGSENGEKMTPV